MIHTIVTYEPSGAVADTISLDCVKSFSETYTATVTTNPVETGTVITDDIIHDQETFSMSGIISDYAFRKAGFKVVFKDGELVAEESTRDSRDELPTLYVKRRLIDLIQNGEVFSIIKSISKDVDGTTLESHFPCVATSLTVNDLEDGAIEVSISIKKIVVATVIFQQIDKATRRLIPFVKPKDESSESATGASPDPNANAKTGLKTGEAPAVTVDKASEAAVKANNLVSTSQRVQSVLASDKRYDSVNGSNANFIKEYYIRMQDLGYGKEAAESVLWFK